MLLGKHAGKKSCTRDPTAFRVSSLITSERLAVCDSTSNCLFLVDSGSEISAIPPSIATLAPQPTQLTLTAANNSPITVHGKTNLTLTLGGRKFTFPFFVAEVTSAIIGVDFLIFFGLTIDLEKRQLLNQSSGLVIDGTNAPLSNHLHSLQLGSINKYHQLLSLFPSLTGQVTSTVTEHPVQHHIVTTGPPVKCKPRRMDPQRLLDAKRDFAELEKQGIVRHSSSPWSCPLHMVKKPDGTWRSCGDYRALNAVTVPDSYPLHHVNDFTWWLHAKKVFSKIDLTKAFYQIRMNSADIEKTAITTPFGSFEFLVMPFGLKNASQTFQRFINQVLREFDFCSAYIDDILVASIDEEQHLNHLKLLFSRLSLYGLTINKDKCAFGKESLDFLGWTVSAKGISPPKCKVQCILDYSKPKTAIELRRFIALVNYYRRSIRSCSELIAPLWTIIGSKTKEEPLEWTDEAESAFEQVKLATAAAIEVRHPVPGAPLQLVTYASKFAVGATLEQVIRGVAEPIGLYSAKLDKNKDSYSVYDKELEAIYRGIKHFSHLLNGQVFKVLTDHKPLTFAFSQNPDKASPRQRLILDYISQFTTDICHLKGESNVVADALSRMEAITRGESLESLVKRIARMQEEDEELRNYLGADQALQLKSVVHPEFNVSLYCDHSTAKLRPFVPESLRRSVFAAIHNLAHPGIQKTTHLIKERYVWPGIEQDVKQWTRGCIQCQRAKITRHNRPAIGTFSQPDARFKHIHIDLVGPLPPSDGKTHILTIIDRFSRWAEVVSLADTSATSVASSLIEHWFSRFGCPSVITSDNGSNLTQSLFPLLYKMLGVDHTKTTPYHPASNGMIERFHRTLKDSLRA